jgi:hypothetical protein
VNLGEWQELARFFHCKKEEDGGSTQNATKQECIESVVHGDPKFIQDEIGRHMAKGQSEKGSKINVMMWHQMITMNV